MRQEKRLYVASFGGQRFNMAWRGRSSKGQGSKITILKVSKTLANQLLTHQKAPAQNVNFTFSLVGADSYTPFQFLPWSYKNYSFKVIKEIIKLYMYIYTHCKYIFLFNGEKILVKALLFWNFFLFTIHYIQYMLFWGNSIFYLWCSSLLWKTYIWSKRRVTWTKNEVCSIS